MAARKPGGLVYRYLFMGSRNPLLSAYLLSAVALAAAALGSLVFMETATIKVSIPASKVAANRTITGGPTSGELATTRIQADVTDTLQGTVSVPAAGGTAAQGTVEFYCSPACSQPVVVDVHQDVCSPCFWTQSKITVPANSTAHVPVAVVAAETGPAYNVAAHTIDRIGGLRFGQPNYPTQLKVTNPQPTTGGATTTSTPAVQQSDLDSVRSLLSAQVRHDLDGVLKAQAGGLTYAEDGQPTLKVTSDHAVGDHVSTFTMTITGSLGATAFSEVQADSLMRATLDQKIPKGFQLTSDPIKTSYVVVGSGSSGVVTLRASAIGVMVPNVNAGELKARIRGMRVEAARQQLKELVNGTTVEISVKPAVPWLPVIQDHINLTIALQPAAVLTES
jgi:hypothetical protein